MLDILVSTFGLPASKTDEYISVFQRQNVTDRATFYACKKQRVEELAQACKMGVGSTNALIAEWQKGQKQQPEALPSGNEFEALPSGNALEALPSGNDLEALPSSN